MDDSGADGPPGAADIARYRENLQGEIDGAAIYEVMAAAEKDPTLRELYRRLAETETRHGGVWRARRGAAGIATGALGPSWRTLRAVGAAITIVTGASAFRSGARQV